MPIRILLAPDKFKGSLSSFEVCDALERGLRSVLTDAEIIQMPMADGGEGWSELIGYYSKGKIMKEVVLNPLFHSIQASWLLSADGTMAFIEMAKASGLQLLTPSFYNPADTSTFGTGQLIAAAINSGAKKIVIGVGGSATNDGGIGMAAALGNKFLDAAGKELSPIGGNLIHIRTISADKKNNFGDTEFIVASDVKNPLCGEHGATRIYGPQKGADAAMLDQLEKGMNNYCSVIRKDLGIDLSNVEGAGAAGGLAAGCVAFLNAEIVPGIQVVWEFGDGDNKVRKADFVITGEGKVDHQTLAGKVVAGVTAKAREHGKPVILVCGALELSTEELSMLGVTAAFSIMDKPMTIEKAIKDAAVLVEGMGSRIGAMIGIRNW